MENSFDLVLAFDYQMTKNIPNFGHSPQPALSFYKKKLSFDVGGLCTYVNKLSQETWVKDCVFISAETAAGPKNSDHALSSLDHWISRIKPSWIRNITLVTDNAPILKNFYWDAWAYEQVIHGNLDRVSFRQQDAGHTKFEPDQRIFAPSARVFRHSDIFLVSHLHDCYSVNGAHVIDLGSDTWPIGIWREALETKFKAVAGIKETHERRIFKDESGFVKLQNRQDTTGGDWTTARILKPTVDPLLDVRIDYKVDSYKARGRQPVLSADKLNDLIELYDKFIPEEDRLPFLPPRKETPVIPEISTLTPNIRTAQQLKQLTVPRLKLELKQQHLAVSGSKPQLISRLLGSQVK